MKTAKRLTVVFSLVVAAGLLLGAPSFSMGSSNCDLLKSSVPDGVSCVVKGVSAVVSPAAPAPAPVVVAKHPTTRTVTSAPRQTSDPTTTPPLHGTNPHGQGTVAGIDTNPDPTRPYTGSTTGNGEDIVVGRSRGEQNADGTYHGHITIASLFGNEIVGVDTTPGQNRKGPLDAVQQSLLTPLCNGSGNQICLSLVTADSSTTSTGSTNHFSTAHATLGGANGIDVGAAESNGNISSDGTCQTSHGDSQVANANAGGQALASVAKSSTDSKACRGQAPTQTNTSSVIGLGGTGVPLPAPGCADGTADTVTGIPTILPIVCNGDDTNGAQGSNPYGVRDALDAFVLSTGTAAAARVFTAGSESTAKAPEAGSQCSDGIDNDGDGLIDAADPGCHSDGNPNNPGSYNPGGTSETNAQCSDGIDNDGDGLIDAKDPGCHTDGNANNAGSYNAADNDESNPAGSGNQGASSSNKPACSDGKDNDGDGLIDANDPGCHSDGNPNNAASYNPKDTSEANAGSGTKGAHGSSKPQCSDAVDNDGDGLIDAADPGCHSDGNANNAASYVPTDNSELNSGVLSTKAAGSLPFTGSDVLRALFLGALLLAAGLALREWPRRRGMRS